MRVMTGGAVYITLPTGRTTHNAGQLAPSRALTPKAVSDEYRSTD